jgi:hypothetical protein
MGTAGPLALARKLLDDGSGQPFFVLNRCAWVANRDAAWAGSVCPQGQKDRERLAVAMRKVLVLRCKHGVAVVVAGRFKHLHLSCSRRLLWLPSWPLPSFDTSLLHTHVPPVPSPSQSNTHMPALLTPLSVPPCPSPLPPAPPLPPLLHTATWRASTP